MFAIAGAAAAIGLEADHSSLAPAVQLLLGAVVGSGVGALGGWLLRNARRRGSAAEEFIGIAVLAMAVLAYVAAVAIGANGFVAAFCGAWPSGPAPAAETLRNWSTSSRPAPSSPRSSG